MSIDHGKLLDAGVERLRQALKMHNEHRTTLQSLASSVGDFLRDYVAIAQPAEAVEGETDLIRKDVHRVLAEGDGYWQACSGCHETNQGYETGLFPYSETFKCHLGSGCTECGGLGAIWFEIPTAAELESTDDAAQGAAAGYVNREFFNPENRSTFLLGRRKDQMFDIPLYTHPQAAPAQGDGETAWREGWALAYSGAQYLYGDDGELQDNRWPMIDWRRDSAMEIRQKIDERGMRALAAAPSPEVRADPGIEVGGTQHGPAPSQEGE